jgi:hypothetical protein
MARTPTQIPAERTLWTCPDCGRGFANRNQPHACARHGLEPHFAGRPPEIRALYEALLERVRACGPEAPGVRLMRLPCASGPRSESFGPVRPGIPCDETPLMRTRFTRWLMVLALAAVLPRAAAAQGGSHTLAPGDTVRVAAPSLHPGVIEGELLLYRGDSLAVREARTGTAYRFPLETIQLLEKNEGVDRGRSVRHWALAGLFVGAAAGLVSGPLIATSEAGGGIVGPTVLTGLGGGVLGLGLGAAGGSLFARDRWQRFSTPILPPAAPGTQVGVTIPAP